MNKKILSFIYLVKSRPPNPTTTWATPPPTTRTTPLHTTRATPSPTSTSDEQRQYLEWCQKLNPNMLLPYQSVIVIVWYMLRKK